MGQQDVYNIMKRYPHKFMTTTEIRPLLNCSNNNKVSLALSKLRRFGFVYRKQKYITEFRNNRNEKHLKYFFRLTPKGKRVVLGEEADKLVDKDE